MGLSMQQVSADLSSMLGGNFVNRFNIDGRSYKVIPQVERDARLTPDQLEKISITGANGQLPRSAPSPRSKQVSSRVRSIVSISSTR